jgi:hypothetical protein
MVGVEHSYTNPQASVAARKEIQSFLKVGIGEVIL